MLSLSFAKLVATPTDTSWSQAYNAGNLFACLSLSKDPDDTDSQLNQIGKELFSHLESEFFTLEEKNLQSIKEAVANSTHIIPSHVKGYLSLVYFKNDVLYVFIYGKGNITLKRGDNIGVLLAENGSEREIKSASGFLSQDDIILLQTHQFAKDMSSETISNALELNLPNDIAEALSPAMHEKDDGGQAGIVIKYQTSTKPAPEKTDDLENTMSEEEIASEITRVETERDVIEDEDGDLEIFDSEETETTFIQPLNEEIKHDELPSRFKSQSNTLLTIKSFISKQKNKINLNHRNKIFLSIAIIIAVLLIASITLTRQKQDDSKTQEQFHAIYDPANKDYEDGIGVKSINKEFATADFQKAQKLLMDGKDKFKTGSKEEKQISDLLSKVDSELGGGSSASSKITPKAVDADSSDLLSIEKDNSGIAFTQNKDAVNMLTSSAVVSVDSAGKKKDLIKNDKDWAKGVGLSAYQGNVYILDQKNGVLKYSAGSDGFGKTNYLKEKPDLSSASAIAIDGSVWILLKNGTILKYTRGVSDGFSVKGLDKNMSGASRIFTNIDTENLYVLDNGNSRIVKINKEGGFQTQYVADILKTAKDLEVSEKDGKITVLSGNKIWEIPL